ncbi:uncharacterized protein LOC120332569 [Styela clava]
MKNVRHNNLARLYNKDAGTRDLIKHVMALCYIPPMFITSRFKSLKEKMQTQELCRIFSKHELYNSVWTPNDWSVFDVEIRTNNHLEGWHRHSPNFRARVRDFFGSRSFLRFGLLPPDEVDPIVSTVHSMTSTICVD